MSHKTGIRGHLVATRDSHEGEPDLEKKIELRRKDRNRNNPRRGSGCGGNSQPDIGLSLSGTSSVNVISFNR